MVNRALFISKNLIGDGLNISPALREWHRLHPDWEIYLATINNHAKEIYSRMGVPLTVVFDADEESLGSEFEFVHNFNVSKAFQICDKKKCHMAEGYAIDLGVTIDTLKPTFIPSGTIPDSYKGRVLLSMHSKSCTSQDPKGNGIPNKMLPWAKWKPILRYIRELGYPIAVIGGKDDRADYLQISEDEYFLGVSLNDTALMMQSSPLLVTIDNGMSHLGASQEVPTFLFYPECLGVHYAVPWGNPNLAVVQMAPSLAHPVQLLHRLREEVPKLKKKGAEFT